MPPSSGLPSPGHSSLPEIVENKKIGRDVERPQKGELSFYTRKKKSKKSEQLVPEAA